MKIAIPIFGSRVSPRFDCAREIAIVTVDEGRVSDRLKLAAVKWPPHERIHQLLELGVDTIVCGGIDRCMTRALLSAGVTIYGWVAGDAEDALSALLKGVLDNEAGVQGSGRCRCRRFAGDNSQGTKQPIPTERASGRGGGGRRHGRSRPARA